MDISRRRVVEGIAASACLAIMFPRKLQAALIEPPLYPPMDLSYFDTPIALDPDYADSGVDRKAALEMTAKQPVPLREEGA